MRSNPADGTTVCCTRKVSACGRMSASQLENDLREAIAGGQLELHYQPIVRLTDLRICGMEALVRWRHPVKGLLSPDLFIPLAEETGLIVQLGEFVVHRACHDAAHVAGSRQGRGQHLADPHQGPRAVGNGHAARC